MVFKFTIDSIVNRYVPENQVPRLPKILGWFLGHNNNTKPKPDYLAWLEILIGSFCGILLLEGVFRSPNVFTDHHNAPIIVASYGATAILCFNANQAPLAQPRNVVFGTFFSAVVGVCLEKLFLLSQGGRDHYYIGGALSVGTASVVMLILNCVHPPAGAAALLPFIDDQIRLMSWWYIPTHIVSSLLITCVALITGNVIGKYPVYWWSPVKKVEPEPPKKQVPDATVEVHGEDLVIPHGFELSEVEEKFLESIQMKLRDFNKSILQV